MTTQNNKIYRTPAGVRLCPLEDLKEQSARNFVLQIKEQYFHGFVVRKKNQVYGYVDTCPHMGLPLAQKLDEYLTPDKQLIACSWHSALFEIETGQCVGGPCSGQRLQEWPVQIQNGMIVTA